MKIYKKEVKSLIRIKISDKNSIKRIVLCDTTLDEVNTLIEKIINYNEQFSTVADKNVLVTMRECTGHLNGVSKSLKSKILSVSDIYGFIINEVTINNV